MAKIGLHDELSLRPAAYNLESPLVELPLYLGLGVVAGLVAVMFKYFSRKVAVYESSRAISIGTAEVPSVCSFYCSRFLTEILFL